MSSVFFFFSQVDITNIMSFHLLFLQEKPNYVRLLDAEGGLVYQSHYKVFVFRLDKETTCSFNRRKVWTIQTLLTPSMPTRRMERLLVFRSMSTLARLRTLRLFFPVLWFSKLSFSTWETRTALGSRQTRYVWHAMAGYSGTLLLIKTTGKHSCDYEY